MGRNTTGQDCCSFCGRRRQDAGRLVAGPAVYICEACVQLCNQILDKEQVASLPQIDDKNDEEILRSMARLDSSRNQTERAVARHVARLRERGITWARIGQELGISRQSAWERFSGEE